MSACVKWAKEEVEAFNKILSRQLSSTERGGPVWTQCMERAKEHARKLSDSILSGREAGESWTRRKQSGAQEALHNQPSVVESGVGESGLLAPPDDQVPGTYYLVPVEIDRSMPRDEDRDDDGVPDSVRSKVDDMTGAFEVGGTGPRGYGSAQLVGVWFLPARQDD
ncbi:hypothetical protein UVI_02057760 [Ustilaginoidea virens]|uniref:Exocyst component Exo84 C-terminal domain-containing protein n=1 Tax=Ustilaginoidea virens TaxID=1159556 RepID=A0A1B5L072_USTVR|nr:hypothetical protein UVI_02057760 [Ustilaginoidea virens]